MGSVPHNLPALLTSFIGRQAELADLNAALSSTRLLTLTGSGGIGKTRLALALAEIRASDYPEGVWLVDLTALADPSLVVQEVAAALGVRQLGARPILEVLVGSLQHARTLIVLDNCEHLLEACAALAEALLKACRGLQVAATSREPLRVPGETVWRVPALQVPDGRGAQQLGASEAVRLFVERAQAVQPTFRLQPSNGLAVAEICRRLDGIPLAIELAAAWTQTLSAHEIAGRLTDRFRLLTGGGRTTLPRHQTLRGTLDWSYGLLTASERLMLCRLSVFEGGWTVQAAEEVCGYTPIDPANVLGVLRALADKSLILADTDRQPVRFRMLETTRQYALELRRERGSEVDSVAGRHAQFVSELAQRAQPALLGPDQIQWLERLDDELDNIRAALRWAAQTETPRLELEITASLWDYWWIRGYLNEGLSLLEAALARAPTHPTALLARATHGAALLTAIQGDLHRAAELFAQSAELFHAAEDTGGAARPLGDLASSKVFVGDTEAGERFVADAIEAAKTGEHAWNYAYAHHHLGQLRLAQGRNEEAVSASDREVQLWRELGDGRGLAHGLLQLAIALRRLRDAPRAIGLAREGLRIFTAVGETWGQQGALIVISACAADLGRLEEAARTLGAVEALSRTIGATPIPEWQREIDSACLRATASSGGADALERGLRRGAATPVSEAVVFANAFDTGTAAHANDRSRLTPREREVLHLVLKRYTNREIAERLVLSVRTVEQHLANIYAKTGVNSRRQLEALPIDT